MAIRTHAHTPRRAALALALLGLAPAALAQATSPTPAPTRGAPAPPRFVLLRAAGEPQAVGLVSFTLGTPGPAEIVYLDAAGERRAEPLSGVVALAPLAWLDPPADPLQTLGAELPYQRLELVDGQRLVGRITGPDHDAASAPPTTPAPDTQADEAVHFAHDRLGALAVPLDRVARYLAEPRRVGDLAAEDEAEAALAAAGTSTGQTDTVHLANGDRLDGLVSRLGPVVAVDCEPVIRAAPSAAGRPGGAPAPRPEPVRVDIDEVLLARLVNPRAPMTGARVELADASVIAASRVKAVADAAQLTLVPALAAHGAPPAPLPLADLAGLVPDAARVTALAALPIAAQERAPGRLPGPGASVANLADAPLGAAGVLLPGPMRVEWALPKGSTRLLGQARLEESALAWGDCTVVVSSVNAPGAGSKERELARVHLTSGTPAAPISADLPPWAPGDRLRVQVLPGPRGPIQNRVLLHRVLILQ